VPDLFIQLSDDPFDNADERALLTDDDALRVLTEGEFVGSKLIPWGSNYSFAVVIEDGCGHEHLGIYKPRDGENPLYDFPQGTLYLREVAAYRLARLLNWELVPPTVIREGPMGVGSLQLYKQPVERDDSCDPREFWSQRTIDVERMVLFDHIANNADRKLSHCLQDRHGAVWGIDHGLCFNVEMKLRTVLWQFIGQPVHEDLLTDLMLLREQEAEVRTELEPLLNESEVVALLRRIDAFIAEPCYPMLSPHRNIPYGWW
jgi:hypothetical protein